MTNTELNAIMCAREIRNKYIQQGLINNETKKIDFNILESIIKDYNGILEHNNNHISYFQKLNEDSFVINIGNDTKDEDNSIIVLEALGLKLFSFDQITKEKLIRFNEYDYNNDFRYINKKIISMFALEFLMPRELLKDSIEDNIGNDNTCDYKKVAIDFNTNYQKVLNRIQYLNHE